MKTTLLKKCAFPLLVTLLSGCGSSSTSEPEALSVGGIGPGGGTIFSIQADTNTGLEVFTAELEQAPWGCSGVVVDLVSVNGSSNGIGMPTGAQSSEIIRAANNDGLCFAAAAQLTFEFSNNGLSDWYLPSTDELLVIRDLGLLAGQGGEAYWSSSEDTEQNAFTVLIQSQENLLDIGEPSTSAKTAVARVVAVRGFQL